MPDRSQALVATGVTYYHENDEAAFFQWLDRIPCVEQSEGEGPDLFIHLSREPLDEDLWELIAFFYRYKINMRQLARFGSGVERAWFRNTKMYWHHRVFGAARREG